MNGTDIFGFAFLAAIMIGVTLALIVLHRQTRERATIRPALRGHSSLPERALNVFDDNTGRTLTAWPAGDGRIPGLYDAQLELAGGGEPYHFLDLTHGQLIGLAYEHQAAVYLTQQPPPRETR